LQSGGALSTWEVFKEILRGVRVDRKKFLLFLGIAALAVGAYYIWQSQNQPTADALYTEGDTLTNTVETNITIKPDGTVLVDNKKDNGTLRFLPDYDEFSLVAFDNPSQYVTSYKATIHLDKSMPAGNVRQLIYAVHGVGDSLYYAPDAKTLVYEVSDIAPGSTVTVVARFSKGMITPPIFKGIILDIEMLTVNVWLKLAIGLPSITLIILMFILYRRRSTQGLISKGMLSVLPDKVPPALAGVVVDGSVGAREIAATLIDLAQRGYIMIVNNGKGEFNFGKRRYVDSETPPGLSDFEKALLSKIFVPESYKSTVNDVEMRIGRHIFSRKIANFYLAIYDLATKLGYFVKNPSRVHLRYKYVGIFLFFVSFLGFFIGAVSHLDPKYALIFWAAGMIASALIIRVAPYMPTLTPLGVDRAREWLAFREYLSSPENIPGADALQDKLNQYLPYAISLGAEVEWIKRFHNEPFAVPEWYESSERAATIDDFASGLFPIIGYVSRHLAKSHDPITE
jgi:hypothetical protein